MNFWQAIEAEISRKVGETFKIEDHHSVAGGCVNECWKISGKGRSFFLKTNTPDFQEVFAAEAEGLEMLALRAAIRVPRPLCQGLVEQRAYLVLEYIPLTPLSQTAKFGEQLAQLHLQFQPCFGWHKNNAIGATVQPNVWDTDWIHFWQTQRLGYQLTLAEQQGAPKQLLDRGGLLNDWMPRLFEGYQVKASPLHGDLWSGNWAEDEQGHPVVFDPACYYGDREADLAMMELFGSPHRAFYPAYTAVLPIDAGYKVRRHFYNLYHILNHYNIFGGGYLGQAERTIDRLLAELK